MLEEKIPSRRLAMQARSLSNVVFMFLKTWVKMVCVSSVMSTWTLLSQQMFLYFSPSQACSLEHPNSISKSRPWTTKPLTLQKTSCGYKKTQGKTWFSYSGGRANHASPHGRGKERAGRAIGQQGLDSRASNRAHEQAIQHKPYFDSKSHSKGLKLKPTKRLILIKKIKRVGSWSYVQILVFKTK